jgi:hypothetical protein
MRKSLRRFLQNAIAYVRHPFGVTCLDCGFLALEQQEVDTSDRILLHCRGAGGCPPLEYLRCFRSLWVELDLVYFGGYPPDDIFDTVVKQRRNCKGYFRYRPGWSPSGHQELLLKSEDKREKIYIALFSGGLGVFLGLFGKWLARVCGLSSP